MSRAVFLDRDGVLNPLVFNECTGEYESPNRPEDFSVYPYIVRSLRALADAGFRLFLISNQPSYAKGKTSMANLQAIHGLLDQYLQENKIVFAEYYYCYHHPNGIVPGYSGACQCRKPQPFFILQAAEKFGLQLTECWMIGDQDTDVQCGQNAGMRTIQLVNSHSAAKRGQTRPDYQVADLSAAVEWLLGKSLKNMERK